MTLASTPTGTPTTGQPTHRATKLVPWLTLGIAAAAVVLSIVAIVDDDVAGAPEAVPTSIAAATTVAQAQLAVPVEPVEPAATANTVPTSADQDDGRSSIDRRMLSRNVDACGGPIGGPAPTCE